MKNYAKVQRWNQIRIIVDEVTLSVLQFIVWVG